MPFQMISGTSVSVERVTHCTRRGEETLSLLSCFPPCARGKRCVVARRRWESLTMDGDRPHSDTPSWMGARGIPRPPQGRDRRVESLVLCVKPDAALPRAPLPLAANAAERRDANTGRPLAAPPPLSQLSGICCWRVRFLIGGCWTFGRNDEVVEGGLHLLGAAASAMVWC